MWTAAAAAAVRSSEVLPFAVLTVSSVPAGHSDNVRYLQGDLRQNDLSGDPGGYRQNCQSVSCEKTCKINLQREWLVRQQIPDTGVIINQMQIYACVMCAVQK